MQDEARNLLDLTQALLEKIIRHTNRESMERMSQTNTAGNALIRDMVPRLRKWENDQADMWVKEAELVWNSIVDKFKRKLAWQ